MAQTLFPFIWSLVHLIWLLFQLVLYPSLTIPNQFYCLNVNLLMKLIPLTQASLFTKFWNHSLFHLTLSVVIVSEWSTFQTDGDCSNPMVAQLSDIVIGGCLNCLKSCHFIGILLFGIRSLIIAWMLNGYTMALGSCIVSCHFTMSPFNWRYFGLFLEGGGGDSTFGRKNNTSSSLEWNF